MEQMTEVKNILDIVKSFSNKNDGTYSIINGQPIEYSDGYQVSFVRPEAYELEPSKWDILTQYLCNYLNSIAHIGVYSNEAEVSFHSLELEKAENIMTTFNQESILNWQKKCEFPDQFEKWFIMNRYFVKEKKVNYNEILESI